MRCVFSCESSSSAHRAWPASWKAITRFSWSLMTLRVCMPATTRSSAQSKSSWTMWSRCWRPAWIAASLQMCASSAPVRPLVWRAMISKSTLRTGLPCVCTLRISWRPLMSGGATRIWRSKRPGRSSAGSSLSSMFEAAMTTTSSAVPKPSISTSSWLSVWSFSPEMSLPRAVPTASSSSMKMIAGAALRAVEQDALRHLRAELLEALRIAQELHDLAQLGLRLVGACNVLPVDRLRGVGLDLLRLRPRHEAERHPDQEADDAHEDERAPREREVREVVPEAGLGLGDGRGGRCGGCLRGPVRVRVG